MLMELISEKNRRIFGDQYIKELYNILRKESSTGRLANSLDYRITQEKDVINFIISGEDYYKYLDEGRKKGSFPPLSAIENWVQIKGIDKKAVFPIAKSIYKFGIKPREITKKVENEVFRGAAFQELEENMANDIEDSVIKIIDKQTKEQ